MAASNTLSSPLKGFPERAESSLDLRFVVFLPLYTNNKMFEPSSLKKYQIIGCCDEKGIFSDYGQVSWISAKILRESMARGSFSDLLNEVNERFVREKRIELLTGVKKQFLLVPRANFRIFEV